MTRDESIQRIRELSQPEELRAFLVTIREKTLPAEWASGKAFEYLILRIFELDGADVVWP
jgi:hypothetical protein